MEGDWSYFSNRNGNVWSIIEVGLWVLKTLSIVKEQYIGKTRDRLSINI